MIKNRTTLKSFFQFKDRPSESQFADLIDSQFNLNEDTVDAVADGSVKKLITVSATPPENPAVNQLWLDTT